MGNKINFIPPLDIIKSNKEKRSYNTNDIDVDDDGCVIMTRTKHGEDIRSRVISKEISNMEAQLKSLKEEAEKLDISKKDIKKAKHDYEVDNPISTFNKKDKFISDPYFSALINNDAMPRDVADYATLSKKEKKKEKKKKKEREKLVGFSIKEPSKHKKKKKTPEDLSEEQRKKREEIEENFKEVEKISRENLLEIDESINFVNNRLNEITENAERMKSKDYIISNYLSAKSTLLSTKQKIATDIGSNRAKIYEIELKQEKNAKDTMQSETDLILKMFPGMAMSGKTDEMNKYLSQDGKNKDSKKKKKKKHWDDDEELPDDEDLSKREKELMKSGDIEYSGYDKHIEYEGTFNLAIKKSFKTGDWKFIALDDDGEIMDIPKSFYPPKSSCNMRFDDESDTALDINSNRSYQVIQCPYI